ncbi:MAG: hypothetical protein KF802_00225 [Bdellovibrionaceae bacterium]|nr:hypothetical protein [Pseudobdellovibrionaceae bacterium]MBX3034795.1 hypothetical protein [Pseudobdellovibrionaceae bacterium]
MKKMMSLTFLLLLVSGVSSAASFSDMITLTVDSPSPVVIDSDTTVRGRVFRAPWYSLMLHVNNQSPKTLVVKSVRVTSTLVGEDQEPRIMDFTPEGMSFPNCPLTHFTDFQPGQAGFIMVEGINCTFPRVNFYVHGNAVSATDSRVYEVKVQVFATAAGAGETPVDIEARATAYTH